jgi:hypothetical protein
LKKKNQKTFDGCRGLVRDSRVKVLASFFKKKRCLPYGCANSAAIGVALHVFCRQPTPNASWIVPSRL